MSKCEVCGEPMPPGEEMFNYHGFSGPCPKPPLAPQQMMSFGQALEALEAGKKVTRAGWNGKGMFLFLVPGSRFQVSRAPLLGIYPHGTEISYHAHVDMKTAQGDVVPWVCPQTDMLAKDWEIVQ